MSHFSSKTTTSCSSASLFEHWMSKWAGKTYELSLPVFVSWRMYLQWVLWGDWDTFSARLAAGPKRGGRGRQRCAAWRPQPGLMAGGAQNPLSFNNILEEPQRWNSSCEGLKGTENTQPGLVICSALYILFVLFLTVHHLNYWLTFLTTMLLNY